MALSALHALAAVIPTLKPPDLGGLERLTLDAERARRGLTAGGHTRLFASRRDPLAPSAVVTPLGKVIIGSTVGEQIVRQPIPLTPTAMEIPNGVEDFAQVDLAWAPSSLAWLGRRKQGFYAGPLLVRQIRWIFLSRLVFFEHRCALLSSWDMRSLCKKTMVLPSHISG
jgi:hypothetical protein